SRGRSLPGGVWGVPRQYSPLPEGEGPGVRVHHIEDHQPQDLRRRCQPRGSRRQLGLRQDPYRPGRPHRARRRQRHEQGSNDHGSPHNDAGMTQIANLVEQGYTAVKVGPLSVKENVVNPARDVREGAAAIIRMREMLGPDVEILIDAHGLLTPPMAVDFARKVAPGLGVELNEAEAARHPYEADVRNHYTFADGSVADA